MELEPAPEILEKVRPDELQSSRDLHAKLTHLADFSGKVQVPNGPQLSQTGFDKSSLNESRPKCLLSLYTHSD